MGSRQRLLVVPAVLSMAVWLGGAASAVTPPARPLRIVFLRHDNVYLLDTATGTSRALTTRGGHGDIYYPWYEWSPDGRYLLLVRGHQSSTVQDLLLLNADGAVLRTLASTQVTSIFAPHWATDANLIAYVASATPSATVPGNVDHLARLDVQGRRSPLWSFGEPAGCGGGTSDPSEMLQWTQTGFGSLAMTFYWSTTRHLAVYTNSLCAGSVDVTDTRSGVTRPLGLHPTLWHEAVVSPSGVIAATTVSANSRTIMLTTVQPGAPVHAVGPGELPRWSRDGRFLYLIRRTPGAVLHMVDEFGNPVDSKTYTTSIWRCNADGSGLVRLASFDAFGAGPLHLTPDGRALVFARVDNSTNLWKHRMAGNRITADLFARYGPHVSVARLGLDGSLTMLIGDAGMPAVQPSAT